MPFPASPGDASSERATSDKATQQGSPLLRVAGRAVATVFRAIPEERRFDAALAFAKRIQRLVARTRAADERARMRTDSLHETSIELLLTTLTRQRIGFSPDLRVVGAEHLPAAGTGPILLVGPHTMLSTLFVRHLEDAGHQPLIVTADARMGVPGTSRRARIIEPSPTLLLKVRRSLEEGRLVAGMIDRDRPERRSSTIDTSAGPVFVSEALIQLAVRSGARIVFIETKLNPREQIVVRLAAPAASSAGVEQILADFAQFVTGNPPPPPAASLSR